LAIRLPRLLVADTLHLIERGAFTEGTDMPTAHIILATIGAVVVGTTAVFAVVAFIRDVDAQPWLDRLILIELVVGILAASIGLVLVVVGPGPADGLHVLYGVVLVVTIGAGRWIAGSAGRRQAGWIAISSAIALGVIARLVMTG
jgi:hypothetical protein